MLEKPGFVYSRYIHVSLQEASGSLQTVSVTFSDFSTDGVGSISTQNTESIIVTGALVGIDTGTIGNGTASNDLAGLDITSVANAAITALDFALDKTNSHLATLGSVVNRLEYAADNLSNISQNTSASQSRVLDADYAVVTTELARTQIIQQAATAMLSQANQYSQSVLSLLK